MDASEHSCHGSSSSLRYYDNHCLGAIRCLLGGQQSQYQKPQQQMQQQQQQQQNHHHHHHQHHRQQKLPQQQKPPETKSIPPKIQDGLGQQFNRTEETDPIGIHCQHHTSSLRKCLRCSATNATCNLSTTIDSHDKSVKNPLVTSIAPLSTYIALPIPLRRQHLLRSSNLRQHRQTAQTHQQQETTWKENGKNCTDSKCRASTGSEMMMTDEMMLSADVDRYYANVCNNLSAMYRRDRQRQEYINSQMTHGPASGGATSPVHQTEHNGPTRINQHNCGNYTMTDSLGGFGEDDKENDVYNGDDDIDIYVDANEGHEIEANNDVESSNNDFILTNGDKICHEAYHELNQDKGKAATGFNNVEGHLHHRHNQHTHQRHHPHTYHHHHPHPLPTRENFFSPCHHSQQQHHHHKLHQHLCYDHEPQHYRYHHHYHHHHHHQQQRHHRHVAQHQQQQLQRHCSHTDRRSAAAQCSADTRLSMREDSHQNCNLPRKYQSHQTKDTLTTLNDDHNTMMMKIRKLKLSGDSQLQSILTSSAIPTSATTPIPPPPQRSKFPNFNKHPYTNITNGRHEQSLLLTDYYRTISPPAEYAEQLKPMQHQHQQKPKVTATNANTNHTVRCSSAMIRNNNYNGAITIPSTTVLSIENNPITTTYTHNVNNHKSLPDLHSEINRYSPHSEILSCCSRGNRSSKSNGGESSLNRDSGGSSGHYTHRSEPCYHQFNLEYEDVDKINTTKGNNIIMSTLSNDVKRSNNLMITGNFGQQYQQQRVSEYRRDSESSTQHSNNSYYTYSSHYKRHAHEIYDSSEYLHNNFELAEVPEAFQDNYIPPTKSTIASTMNTQCAMRNYDDYNVPVNNNCKQMLNNDMHIQSPVSGVSMEDISPPPMQFKRQKCIRYKNHNRLLLIPSSSSSVMGTMMNNNGGGGMIKSQSQFKSNSSLAVSQNQYDKQEEKIDAANESIQFISNIRKNSMNSNTSIKSKPIKDVEAIERRRAILIASVIAGAGVVQFTPMKPATEIEVEQFFDRLGLNEETFNEVYVRNDKRCCKSSTLNKDQMQLKDDKDDDNDSDTSTTVYFSDISTVDSMRLPDSIETQSSVTLPYRSIEPPSIVERNARIIKWLCNIRKAQTIDQY